jgi:3-hydroxyacyl-CoA dehydrogenase
MKIKKISCIGTGLIGRSWATLFAAKGYPVVLMDSSEAALKSALEGIKSNVEFLIDKAMLKEDEAKTCIKRIQTATTIADAVSSADYVQESTPENYDTKKAVFKEMDSFAPDRTILASSSSGLFMTEIQKATNKPQRCIIVHPWNPPLLIPLVELVPGNKTSSETVDMTRRFMESIGKIPVTVKKEVPGYVGNRLQSALWREAIDLVDKGVASVEDVDKAISAGPGLRWALMGPHMVLHLGGGPGGMKYYIEHLGPAHSSWWKSMDTWTSISPLAAEKIIEGVNDIQKREGKTYEELAKWRDDKLAELLKVISQNNK